MPRPPGVSKPTGADGVSLLFGVPPTIPSSTRALVEMLEHTDWRVVLPEIARTPSVEDGAGIYLHEGRTHLVGHHSTAEDALLEAGALLVATVRFDRDPAGSPRRGHGVSRIDSATAARFPPPPSRN